MTTDFDAVLRAALTPVALISGVGLLLLSMINRYHHALNRIRQLMAERLNQPDPALRQRLTRSIQIIYKRCHVMKNAILCILSSIVASSALVFLTVIEGFWGVRLVLLKSSLLVGAVALVSVAVVLFVVEVRYSLRALELELAGDASGWS
jgi:Mg2+ and Co2+ transporter CorA